MNERIILTDCDGVLLKWNAAFSRWMTSFQGFTLHHPEEYEISKRYEIPDDIAKQLVVDFNNSTEVGHLEPCPLAFDYVRLLHGRYGYRFVVISCLSDEPLALSRRQNNLYSLFGEKAFVDISCLPIGADKRLSLVPYTNSGFFWLEDNTHNAELGLDLGLKPVLFTAAYNADCDKRIPRVTNWYQFYQLLLKTDEPSMVK